MRAELSSCSVPYRPLGPEEYGDWREPLCLIAVTDVGSQLGETGSNCVKAGAHLNSDACVVLHIWSDLQEEGKFPPFVIFR